MVCHADRFQSLFSRWLYSADGQSLHEFTRRGIALPAGFASW